MSTGIWLSGIKLFIEIQSAWTITGYVKNVHLINNSYQTQETDAPASQYTNLLYTYIL